MKAISFIQIYLSTVSENIKYSILVSEIILSKFFLWQALEQLFFSIF